MSRLGVAHALWGVYKSAEATELYRDRPSEYLEPFDLTPEEREALESKNQRALIAMRTHPFLVYMAMFRIEGQFSIEFVERYTGSIKDLGIIDIET